MNGRCETDPLDRAVDVCDSCYGEFCSACLVQPKGRRHPICSECALIAAGVRAGAQPDRRGSRRSSKKRRAALKEQFTDEPKLFEFFDAVGSDDDPAPEPEPTDETSEPRANGDPEPEPTDETGQDESVPEQDSGPIGDLASAPEPEEAPTESTGVQPTTPAVAKLNQIRETQQQDEAPAPEPESEPDLRAVAKSTVVREPDGQPEESEPTVKPEPPVAAPRRRRSDQVDGDGERQATAPMIGEVRVIGGRRSTDIAEPEPDPQPDLATVGGGAITGPGAPNAVDEFDAGGRDAIAASTKADTDASGNWIPPILRGMAPDAREAKASLPQRRKRED